MFPDSIVPRDKTPEADDNAETTVLDSRLFKRTQMLRSEGDTQYSAKILLNNVW